jgi:CheY-like chemotaxis protein
MNVELDETYVHAQNLVRPGEYVLLEVTDSGTGIPPEHLPHIFEPFYTTKEQGKGTGLGLATVYGIVKQSGGYIWVYSEHGRGTTFRIYLPRVRKQAATLAEVKPIQEQMDLRGTETVLVVEDEGAVRQTLCDCLQRYGYRVLEACNGMEALTIAKEHSGPVHLLVADVVMPSISGWQVAEMICATRPETKVMFMSGYAEKAVTSRGVPQLREGFLQKPFTLRALALKVREILGKTRVSATATS